MSIETSIKKSLKIHQTYHKTTRYTNSIVKDNNFTYRLLIEVLNKQINKKGSDILDIGCGAGTISLYLANKGHSVEGIDISTKAILACRKSAKLLGFKKAKFSSVAFPEEMKSKKKYDFVIFTEVIEHLENDSLALEEIYKVLKANGILIMSTPSIKAPLNRLGLTSRFDRQVGHLRRYTLNQLKTMLKEKKFKIVEVKKTEGIFRNFLFVNPYAGHLIRILNHFGSNFATAIDKITLKLFGESNYIIVARKVVK